MKKIGFGIITLVAVLAVSGVVGAEGVARYPSTVLPSGQTVVVPDKAVDNSPVLEKVLFVHYKGDKVFAKPSWAGGGKGETQCYDFLAKGTYWKELPVSYVVHPDLEAVVSGAMFASAETWDAETSQELFFDVYTLDASSTWDGDPGDVPDGKNELLFGNYASDGVIAVTVVWGYFSGPPQTRKITEFDILFDTDYVWGNADLDSGVMDLANIATHELGHGVGLADIYNSACSTVTMYGYSVEGETNKRSLEPADVKGLQEMYGA